jgi:hypothetical protein
MKDNVIVIVLIIKNRFERRPLVPANLLKSLY